MRYITVAAALLLAACGTATAFSSPASISLTRHVMFSDPAEIGQKATEHCARYGKVPRLAQRNTDDSGYFEIMTFDCVAR